MSKLDVRFGGLEEHICIDNMDEADYNAVAAILKRYGVQTQSWNKEEMKKLQRADTIVIGIIACGLAVSILIMLICSIP